MVQRTETIYGHNRTFTSSQQHMLVTGASRYYTDGFSISATGLSTSGTDPTLDQILALIAPLEIDVAGIPQIRLDMDEIYGMNVLKYGNMPLLKNAGSVNNQTWFLSSMWLDAWFPPSNSNTTASLTYGGNAAYDNERVTLAAHYLDSVPRTEAQFYNKITMTTTSTQSTAFGDATTDVNLVGNMTGCLIKSQTVPSTTVAYNAGTVDQFRIQNNGETLQVWDWIEAQNPKIFTGQNFNGNNDDGVTALDNFRYIDMSKEPIPAGSKINFGVMAGVASETVTLIPFQSVPFR